MINVRNYSMKLSNIFNPIHSSIQSEQRPHSASSYMEYIYLHVCVHVCVCVFHTSSTCMLMANVNGIQRFIL